MATMSKIDEKIERSAQFIKFCRGLFKTSNLIGLDFEDINVMKVERTFEQDDRGVHVQFSVSRHLIGKANEETSEALELLLQDDSG